MSRQPALWPDAAAHLRTARPESPVLYFRPARLRATAERFLAGFPGLVTYAVKANDAAPVLETLVGAGIRAFDVASPAEMAQVRAIAPGAVMHYNNPVRSKAEIHAALAHGIRSFAVDDPGELDKLTALVPAPGVEISVRLKLPVKGAYYDFGAKFGADPSLAEALLIRAAERGFTPSMTFHPGTQCADPVAWATYIHECAAIARRAGRGLSRLNVGGGFPAHRGGTAPDLDRFFRTIGDAARAAFGDKVPDLVCEPGRAMAAEAYMLAARVKSRRAGGAVYLNDGIYGGLSEAAGFDANTRIEVLAPDGHRRTGPTFDAVVYGPTCDSLDRMRDRIALPDALEEEDYILFDGMGAYSTATATGFNGYGAFEIVTLGERL